MYDIDYIMEQFELYCEPICNFCAARYKFRQVSQRENEMTNAFYHRIQKLCLQCQFNDDKECLVDAIIYGTKVQKARKKLLQMPKHLTLHDCLKICHHYESLQYHLNIISTEVENNHQLGLRSLVHLEVNPLPNQLILLITWSNVVKFCGTTHPKNQSPAF